MGGNNRYPELNEEIFDRSFPQLEGLVQADEWRDVVSDVDQRAPSLSSNHPDHPTGVSYAIKLSPEAEYNMMGPGDVAVKIDGESDTYDAAARIRRHRQRFRGQGFRVAESMRPKYEIVWCSWSIEPDAINDEETIQAVADRFVELVELGHAVLTE